MEALEVKVGNSMKFVARQLNNAKKARADPQIIDEWEEKSIRIRAQFNLIGELTEELLEKNDAERFACQTNSTVDVPGHQGEEKPEFEGPDGNMDGGLKEKVENNQSGEGNEEGGNDVVTGGNDG